MLLSLVLFPLPILSLLWEACSVILRIVQHKIFFIVRAIVILGINRSSILIEVKILLHRPPEPLNRHRTQALR